MTSIFSAGTKRFVPAVLFVTALVVGLTSAASAPFVRVPAGVSRAEAGEKDLFPEPGKEKAPEQTPLERAVSRVEQQVRRDGGVPDSEDAVRFLLLLYARDGSAADLERATAMARRLAGPAGGAASPQVFYELAQAGAGTLGEAESLFQQRAKFMGASARATTDTYASFVRDLLARAAALREPGYLLNALMAMGDFFAARTQVDGNRLVVLPGGNAAETASLSDYVETLRAVVEAAQASGSPVIRTDAVRTARELLHTFWDGDAGRLRLSADEGDDPVLIALLNMRAAKALSEAGWIGGDALLTGRAERILDDMLPDALKNPVAAPAAALAAARIGGHPVQMVLVGGAGDPTLLDLRQECFFTFEPRRLMLSLDPVEDAARLEELGYPTEISPALFVCVGVICSAPLSEPGKVESALHDILGLAREAGH